MLIAKCISAANKELTKQKAKILEFSPNKTQLLPPDERCQALGLPVQITEGKEKEAEECLKAFEEFAKGEYEVPFPKLSFEFLTSHGEWTPADYEALEPILNPPSEGGMKLVQ